MRTIGFVVLSVLAIGMLATVACGDDKPVVTGGEGTGVVPGGGMVAPNQFMTYDGQRYELVNMLLEDMVPSEEFSEAGVATEADVDLKGDKRVFRREGDSSAVYTYSAPTSDDVGYWLAWRPAS